VTKHLRHRVNRAEAEGRDLPGLDKAPRMSAPMQKIVDEKRRTHRGRQA